GCGDRDRGNKDSEFGAPRSCSASEYKGRIERHLAGTHTKDATSAILRNNAANNAGREDEQS
ncbi:hypothetical protein LSAT2_015859, partial [Lamellibrachia satsuma]